MTPFAVGARAPRKDAPELRRLIADVAIQSGTGKFFAYKFRSAILWSLYEQHQTFVDECSENALARHDNDLLEVKPRFRRLLRFGHAVDHATAPSGVIRAGSPGRLTRRLQGSRDR